MAAAGFEDELGVLFGEILTADAAVLDLTSADRLISGCQRVRAVVSAREAALTVAYERLAREAAPPSGDDGSGSAGAGSSDPPPPPPRPAPAGPRESSKERQRRQLRAKWLGFCQRFAAALAAGTITTEHADVLARTLDRTAPGVVADLMVDEAALVLRAQACTSEQFADRLLEAIARILDDGGVSEFARQVADSRAWASFDKVTGMYSFGVILDPARGPAFESAIRQRMNTLHATPGATRELTEAQVRLQAMIDLVCGGVVVVPEAIVVTDEETVRTGRHPATVAENIDGIRLPVDRVIECCATGKVTVAVLDANGRVVASACTDRTATTEQRRLLRAMYRTCAHPDCSVSFSACQMHHVAHWEHGGPTSVANLVPLCHAHHHLVHEGGWRLTIDRDRTLTWTAPDGTTRTATLQSLLRTPSLRAVGQPDPTTTTPTGSPPGRAPPPNAHTGATAHTATANPAYLAADDNAVTGQLFGPHAA